MTRNSFPAGENVIFFGRHHQKGMHAAVINYWPQEEQLPNETCVLVCDGTYEYYVLVGRVLHVREESVR
eukprot:11714622-Prorocentrum_lima.AAC.1